MDITEQLTRVKAFVLALSIVAAFAMTTAQPAEAQAGRSAAAWSAWVAECYYGGYSWYDYYYNGYYYWDWC